MSMYAEWAQRHPIAAAELEQMHAALPWPASEVNAGKSEAWAQQQVRFQVFRAGGMAWRNNVGATPAAIKTTCPKCGNPFQIKQQPTRYGLANDSRQLNEQVKSADLILAIPRLIMPQHVGQTIAQFGSVEVKRPGWKKYENEHNSGQDAWGSIVTRLGGYHRVSTGELDL